MNPDLFVAAGHEEIVACNAPNRVYRLSQCGSSVILIELRPKHPNEMIPPQHTTGIRASDRPEAPATWVAPTAQRRDALTGL
jgi:hypothetical protein